MTYGKGKLKQQRYMTSPPLDVMSHRQRSSSPPLRAFSSSASSSGSTPVRQFPPEVDAWGNVEHKLRLTNIPKERLEHLRTQMKWRVEEGRGEAIYRIGVMDDGEAMGLCKSELSESIDTLKRVAGPLGFDIVVLETFEGILPDCRCATVAIRRGLKASTQDSNCRVMEEVRVAIVGASESGKSSITGFLTRGIADDGRGKAGRCVALHKHEIRHGRTSSFSSHALPRQPSMQAFESGSSSSGRNVSMKGVENIFSDMDLEHDQTENGKVPSKVVSLIDTGGHRKALSSCLRGLSACVPDHLMICLDIETASGAHPERLQIALDFLRLARGASIPYILVITKSDLEGFQVDHSIVNLFGNRIVQATSDSIDGIIDQLPHVVPLVYVSAVTGSGMDCLCRLLNSLPSTSLISSRATPKLDCGLESALDKLSLKDDKGKATPTTSVLEISRQFVLASDDDNTNKRCDDDGMLFMGGEEEDSNEDDMQQLFGAGDDEDDDMEALFQTAISSTQQEKKIIAVGVVQSGQFQVGQTICVGPGRATGAFAQATIVSMRCASGTSVSVAMAGTTVSLHLKFTSCPSTEGHLFASRGGFICDQMSMSLESRRMRTFQVDFLKPAEGYSSSLSLLRKNEEVLVYCGVVNQACRVIHVEENKDNGRVTLQFVYRPEYLLRNVIFIKRGCTGGSILVGELAASSSSS